MNIFAGLGKALNYLGGTVLKNFTTTKTSLTKAMVQADSIKKDL